MEADCWGGVPAGGVHPRLAGYGLSWFHDGHQPRAPARRRREIKRQIDFLARWKANQYYFYSEASIELRGYELVNPDARYSQEQIRRIIDYARVRHVDVVPTVELYGHLHDLFRIERYADLSLLPHSGEINPRNERTQALVADWVQQLAALFPSPWFHIGFDEPWELERAGSILGGVDPSSLYIERLKQTVELVEKAGKRPMFWADVQSGAHLFEKYPNLFSQLPKSVIAVPWVYYPKPDLLRVCCAVRARAHSAGRRARPSEVLSCSFLPISTRPSTISQA